MRSTGAVLTKCRNRILCVFRVIPKMEKMCNKTESACAILDDFFDLFKLHARLTKQIFKRENIRLVQKRKSGYAGFLKDLKSYLSDYSVNLIKTNMVSAEENLIPSIKCLTMKKFYNVSKVNKECSNKRFNYIMPQIIYTLLQNRYYMKVRFF